MGPRRRRQKARANLASAVVLALTLPGWSCADRLPDQDLRILTATPSAKLSVSLLWQEYVNDPDKAGRRYRRQPVEITGDAQNFVLGKTPEGPDPTVTFPQGEPGQVTAHLLTEQASRVEAALQSGPRITLRCFVDGLEAGGKNLSLRSCIAP
jgi:hypothetical protein